MRNIFWRAVCSFFRRNLIGQTNPRILRSSIGDLGQNERVASKKMRMAKGTTDGEQRLLAFVFAQRFGHYPNSPTLEKNSANPVSAARVGNMPRFNGPIKTNAITINPATIGEKLSQTGCGPQEV